MGESPFLFHPLTLFFYFDWRSSSSNKKEKDFIQGKGEEKKGVKLNNTEEREEEEEAPEEEEEFGLGKKEKLFYEFLMKIDCLYFFWLLMQ